MEEKFDWTRFTIKTPIKSTPDNIFNLWVTQQGLESWFLRKASFTKADGSPRDHNEEIQVGDTYKWLWPGYPDSVIEEGEILENNGKDFLRFTFGKAGIVNVKVYEQDGITLLELTQEEIPIYDGLEENYHVGCKTGWTFYLANLNSIVQGGVDIRNFNKELSMD